MARRRKPDQEPPYAVEVVNVMSVGTRCGIGRGWTLKEAQDAALQLVKSHYPNCNPQLSESGWTVFISSPVRL